MAKNYTKEQVLEAIRGSFGIYTDIADLLHCAPHTAQKYCDKWEETRQAVVDESLRGVEAAEKVIFNAIGNKDVATAKWLIEMKGRVKGYQRDAVLKIDNQDPLNISIDGMTREQLAASEFVEINDTEAPQDQ